MVIGVLKETGKEKRVALLPGEISVLKKMGVAIIVESHAGENAFASDKDFETAGATMMDRKGIIEKSDILISVNPPVQDPLEIFREGKILCSVINPTENKEWLEKARLK